MRAEQEQEQEEKAGRELVPGGVEQSVGPTSQRHQRRVEELGAWLFKDRIFTFLFLLM